MGLSVGHQTAGLVGGDFLITNYSSDVLMCARRQQHSVPRLYMWLPTICQVSHSIKLHLSHLFGLKLKQKKGTGILSKLSFGFVFHFCIMRVLYKHRPPLKYYPIPAGLIVQCLQRSHFPKDSKNKHMLFGQVI